MPSSSVVICKLNANWHNALRGSRFKIEPSHVGKVRNKWGDYDFHGPALKDCKNSSQGKFVAFIESIASLQCCGMEELTFGKLHEAYSQYKSDPDWNELIAKYIKFGITETDNRVLIVGIPVQVGSRSMYNVEFYEKIRQSLVHFGFKQIGEEYRNQNSGNRIIVLAGQL